MQRFRLLSAERQMYRRPSECIRLVMHYLELAGTLYVFVQDGLEYRGVVEAIAAVLNRLPTDSALRGIHIDDLIQPEWISQFVTDDLDTPSQYQGESPNARRHI